MRRPPDCGGGHGTANTAEVRVPSAAALSCVLLLGAVGCAGEKPPPRVLSVRATPGTPLSERDAEDFLRLAAVLGPEALAPLAAVRPDPPEWPDDSTRTVAGLAAGTREAVDEAFLAPDLAAALAAEPSARRFLDELGWSPGRFASIGGALGAALIADDLPDEREIRRLRADAAAPLAALAGDRRVFASLIAAERAAVGERAAWIPRAALLDALLACPPENRRLARAHAATLRDLFPDGFDRFALDRLTTERQRAAVPFHEPDADRDDANLWWDGARIVTRP